MSDLSGQQKIQQLAESLSDSPSSASSTSSPPPPLSPIMVNDLETQLINEDNKPQADESELCLVQDSVYTVKIAVPNMDPFDLQVTSMELVQEIHQMLMDKEETCHRTCFSLQLNNQVLDNFSELKNFEECKEGVVIRLVEEAYTVREVRLHVRHVNELIHSTDAIDNFNAVNCNSLSYVNDLTNNELNREVKAPAAAETGWN
jgi:protein TIF31